jgi:hypothetical protein
VPPKPTPPSTSQVVASPAPAQSRALAPIARDEARLRNGFQALRKAHREAILQHGLTGGLFQADRLLFRREARLFAAAYPDLAESFAAESARDPSLDWRERLYAVDILGFLAAAGRASVRPQLRAMAAEPDEHIRSCALAGVGMADVNGAEKALYWEQCRAGSATAFAFVALWPDSGTVSEMNALVSTVHSEDAQDVLRKIELLGRSDWKERLGRIVQGERSKLDDPVDWALGCLRRRSPDQLRTLLRSELDAAGERAHRWWAQQQPTGSFDQDFQAADDVSNATGRKDYDLFLVTQWQIGGDLTDVERRRLREFGYAPDPSVRLAELLGPK